MPSREAVDRRHRERQAALVDGVAGRLDRLVRSSPDLEQPTIDRYVRAAYPAVAAGQYAAAGLGAGYLAVLVPRTPRTARRPVDVDGALARSGVLVTPESRSLVAPMLRARALTADGLELGAALETAGNYAGTLSSYDLQAAQRVGLDAGAAAVDAKVEGWQKDPGPGACSWCVALAAEVYADPDAVPFHDFDKCGVVPAIDLADVEFSDDDIPF